MTLDEIARAFRTGKLDQQQALKELEKAFVTPRLPKAAQALLDEILGMEAEPRPMSTSERESAERWEKGYRGDDK